MYWQASMDLTPAFLSQVFLKHNQQWTPWILCFSSVVGIHGLLRAKHAVHAWATSPALCIFFLCFIYTSPSRCTHHLCRKSGPVSSHILWADQAKHDPFAAFATISRLTALICCLLLPKTWRRLASHIVHADQQQAYGLFCPAFSRVTFP